ncbi:hypothetical protein AAGR40_004643 [Salmonella enterica]
MKKKLIVLVVTASTIVSGSAMAWTANGIGGSVEFGGALTPQENVTPWAIQVGNAVNDLNAPIKKGATTAKIPVNTSIPVLGIRTHLAGGFMGESGISPQVNYGDGHVALDGFNASVSTLTLDVTDGKNKIGSMSAPFTVAAVVNGVKNDSGNNVSVYATNAGDVFYGGVSKTADGVIPSPKAQQNLAKELIADSTDNYVSAPASSETPFSGPLNDSSLKYNGFYASGIKVGSTILINLNTPATGDSKITWKANLPVTVSYQ